MRGIASLCRLVLLITFFASNAYAQKEPPFPKDCEARLDLARVNWIAAADRWQKMPGVTSRVERVVVDGGVAYATTAAGIFALR